MSHSQKLLSRMNKKAMHSARPSQDEKKVLREQYETIKEDIVRLKEDLQRSYDVAKGMVEKRGLIKQIIKSK